MMVPSMSLPSTFIIAVHACSVTSLDNQQALAATPKGLSSEQSTALVAASFNNLQWPSFSCQTYKTASGSTAEATVPSCSPRYYSSGAVTSTGNASSNL